MISARNINSSLRIRELSERYATTLPALADEVESVSAKVGEHLKRMGVV